VQFLAGGGKRASAVDRINDLQGFQAESEHFRFFRAFAFTGQNLPCHHFRFFR
jgi:hypothetical protein